MTPGRYRAPLAIAGLLFIIPSCGDDPPVQPTPGSPTAATLTITPETVLFTALGDTVRLTAEVRDQQGRPMSGADVAWTSSDASVAAVAQSGVARAIAAGTATITATSGSVSDDALITVRQDVASVVVSPRVASLVVGDTVRLTAEARDANGNPIPGSTFVWRTSNEQVAGVDSTGLVRAHGRGEATITATSGSVSDDALVTVRQDVASVVVSPRVASLVVGDTVRLTAEARDANGNPIPGSAFVWRTSNEQVAGVDSTGLVRAYGRGEATITAASAGATGSAAVSVAPPNLPPNFVVDEGTSHSLQFAGLHVAHHDIRPAGGHTPAAIAYADYSGDGLTDIFYSSLDGSRNPVPAEMYINDGMGGFALDDGFFGSNPPGGVHPRKALPGDFNGDGRPDVFVLGHGYDHEPFPGEAPYAILSSASGYVQAEGLDSIIGFHHGGASADIDADGDLDVFVTENFKGPFFLINDGNGSFMRDTVRIDGIGAEGIFTAELVDVDQDGYVDLLAAGHEYEDFSTRILWGNSSGVFSTSNETILSAIQGLGIVVDIDVADTDADGDKDIVLNRTGSPPQWYRGYFVQLLEQTAARSFADRTEQLFPDNRDAEADGILWLRIFDIDEDGDPDIFADEASRGLIWKNDGAGQFQLDVIPPNYSVDEGTSHSLQSPPFRIDHSTVRDERPGWADAWAYGDFSGDGHVDILYAPMDGSSPALPAELYVNDGSGGFSFAPGFMDGSPPALISATKALPGDYNSDGRMDVFIAGNANWSGETPHLILSSGTGYVRGTGLDVFSDSNLGASADIDADGDVDVFLTGRQRFLLNDGNGSFRRGAAVDGLGFILSTELVDVDHDGYVDLLVGGHEQDGDTTRIIWGSETGRYSVSNSTVLPGVAGHGVILDMDVGDTDADGDKDIVITRTGDGTGIGFYQGYYVQLVENTGDRQFRDVTSSRVPENRDDQAGAIRWLHIYDVDGDADVDLVVDDYQETELFWRNDGGGRFRRERGGS